jgi:hypothetical protein
LEAIFRAGNEPDLILTALVRVYAKTDWKMHPLLPSAQSQERMRIEYANV